METTLPVKRNKGGRPPKMDKRSQQLAVMCTITERKQIEEKARMANLSVSEFLRTLALQGQVGRKIKQLPKEILLFTATLNHLAANMNQLARQRNQGNDLSPAQRVDLIVMSTSIKRLALDIKKMLR